MTRPGRPATFDRDEVLARALELFWTNGYRSTSTRQLEQTLDMGASSIYNAFGSKQELLLEALALYEARVTEHVLAPLEASSTIDGIGQFIGDLTRWVSTDGKRGCMIINLMAEDAGEDGEISKRTRRYRTRVRGALKGALERAGIAQAKERADVLFALCLGLNISARGGSQRDVRRIADSARSVVADWPRG